MTTYDGGMEFLYNLFLVLHFVGWAIVLGGWIASLKSAGVYKGVFHGALTALVSGIVMVGIASASDAVDDPNNTKIAVKLVFALIVTILAYLANKKGDKVSAGVKYGIGGLTLVNILIAVFW